MFGSSLKHFGAIVRRHLWQNLGSLLWAGLGLATYTAADLLAPWPIKILLDQVLLGKPWPTLVSPDLLPATLRNSLSGHPEWVIGLLALAIVFLALCKGASAYLHVFLTARVGYQLVHRLRSELFGHLQTLSLAFHHRSRTGELLTKITADTNVLKDVFAAGLLELGGHLFHLLAMCAVLLWMNAKLAAMALLTLPLLSLTVFHIYRRGKSTARHQRQKEGHVAAHLSEVLQMTQLVRTFARERDERARFEKESRQTLEQSIRAARAEAAASRTVELIHAAGLASAVFVGGLLAARGEITPGTLLIFTAYLGNMFKPLRQMAKLSLQFSKAMASAERMEQILATEADGVSRDGGIRLPRLRGQVVFDDVWFGYQPGQPVLRGLSFAVQPGEHVALVGASGAGKSTLANLLLRIYRADHGSVRLDGCDVTLLDAESYRRQIGVVLQDALLFGATIAENIGYGAPDASRAAIVHAARLAHAHDFISALPQGYDTVMQERASTLSGGQRQRICLARALVKQPQLLLLDEPTAAIDAESAARIHQTLADLQRGKTTLVIAHHFFAMERFHRILVLENGVVAESGSHAELLARHGAYWRLYQQQAKDNSSKVLA